MVKGPTASGQHTHIRAHQHLRTHHQALPFPVIRGKKGHAHRRNESAYKGHSETAPDRPHPTYPR